MSGSFDKTVRVWSLQTGQCLKVFKRLHSAWIYCMEIVSDTLFTGGADKLIRATDVVSGESKGAHMLPFSAVWTLAIDIFVLLVQASSKVIQTRFVVSRHMGITCFQAHMIKQ